MEVTRGDIVIAAHKGAMTGKPRPILVVQNQVATREYRSITACLISTQLKGASLVRLAVSPNPENGLNGPSEIQVDLIYTFLRDTIVKRIGCLSTDEMLRVDEALRRWLDL